MRKFLACLLVFFAAFSLALAAADEAPVGIDRIAIDGQKRIYAFNTAWSDRLAVYEAGRWQEFAVHPAEKPAQPRGIVGLRDGRIGSVWNVDESDWVLSILDGREVVETIAFSWNLDSWDRFEMTEDSDGQIWLTGGFPEVIRCEPATRGLRTFDLRPHGFRSEAKEWNAVHFTQDGHGNRWLWTSNRASNQNALNTPLRVAGDTLEVPPILGETFANDIVQLSVRDANSLWWVTRNEGLVSLSLDGLTLNALPEPKPGVFRSVDGLVPLRNGCLILTGVGSRSGVWQWIDDRWIERLPPGTIRFIRWNLALPASLELASGVIVAAENGILFLPTDGEKFQFIDWRNGWPMSAPSQFLPLGGDRFTALTFSGTPPRWVTADMNDLLEKRPVADTEEILPWRGWAVDDSDRVFTMMGEKAPGLSVWDAGAWRIIPLPTDLESNRVAHIEIDGLGRIWLFSDDTTAPVGILSADLQSWETRPDYPTALVTHRDGLGEMGRELWWLRPVVAADDQIAFRTQNWKIMHWDGGAWRTWELADIGEFSEQDRVSTPFFDGEGDLCVNTRKSDKTWRLGPDGDWTSVVKLPGIEDMWTDNIPRRVDRTLPEDFQPTNLREPWVAKDNLGMTWAAANNNLFKYYKGRTVAIFDESRAHPFLKNPPISSVRVDRFGNTWLQLGIESINHAFIPASEILAPKLALKSDKWGFVTIDTLPESFIEWRTNEGPWQTLPPSETALGYLPAGTRSVELLILTDRLEQLGPIQSEIEIEISSSDQVAHLIDVLMTGPFDRKEAAVRGLTRQLLVAIPALRLAASTTDSWWVQAALQECERQTDDSRRKPTRSPHHSS